MTIKQYTTRSTCRVCGSRALVPLFSLGEQYVSDFPKKEDLDKGILCPIDIEQCQECTLVQAKHTAPQELLYSKHYWYRSGVTATMREALAEITKAIVANVPLYPGDVVLDIGSNDGTLLRSYPQRNSTHHVNGIKTVGVEPATNLQEEGRKGLDVFINDFWDYEIYKEKVGTKAKVITAIGMFYDMEDPNKFVQDIAFALAPDGVFVAQLMCLNNMINMHDIGNFAHEHLEFYTLKSLEFLFDRYNLEIYDIETNKVNGQSYRLWVRHIGSSARARAGAAYRMQDVRMIEKRLESAGFYKNFFLEMEANKHAVVNFIKDRVIEGKKVWIYGASTKGNSILQYYGLDSSLIEGAAERSPEKYGRYTVGTNIPIYSEEEARAQKPDYFLCLPFSFREEFLKRESAFRAANGRFIFPLPKLEIV